MLIKKTGFTLVEVVIAIGVSVLVLLGIVLIGSRVLRVPVNWNERAVVNREFRVELDRLADAIRGASFRDDGAWVRDAWYTNRRHNLSIITQADSDNSLESVVYGLVNGVYVFRQVAASAEKLLMRVENRANPYIETDEAHQPLFTYYSVGGYHAIPLITADHPEYISNFDEAIIDRVVINMWANPISNRGSGLLKVRTLVTPRGGK